MQTTPKRLKILEEDELEILYGRPHFTPEDQQEYFTLSREEHALLDQFHSRTSRLYCVLQLGYFKARHLFFVFEVSDVMVDAVYIRDQYFPGLSCTDLTVTKVTRLRQQHLILALYNYRTCRAKERQQLASKAQQAARVDSKPIYIFRELTHYLAAPRLVLPAYSVMQNIVGYALSAEQRRLTSLLRRGLSPADVAGLQSLLNDTTGLYAITLLKREPRDFSQREINREIERKEQLGPFYTRATALLPRLDISNESVKYYASLVTYYSVFRLKQLEEWIVYLYLLCFVVHGVPVVLEQKTTILLSTALNVSPRHKST